MQVLVVGAGPSGLAAALVLVRLGVTVRIIAHALIEAGRPTRAAWLHFDDRAPIEVDLGTIPSPFDFILNLEQSETERILEQRLAEMSVRVERQTELVEAVEQGASILSRIKRPNGDIEPVTSEFMIGCDGARSTVRHLLGIPFQGSAYTGDFLLGDVTMEWSWPYDSVQLFVNERGVIASFPLKGERRYRLILVRQGESDASQPPDLELGEFQSILSDISAGRIVATDASWLTRFRVHQRRVREMQRGRIFLAGDAAHIHSPAGGQGMNTGIQDALNLGFKLAEVLAQRAPGSRLRDYERERLPVARRVLRGTDAAFRLALMPESGLKRFLRSKVLPMLVGSRWIQRRAP